MKFKISRAELAARFNTPLPGEEAQFRMSPQFRGEFQYEVPPKKAAVMLLLFPYPDCINLLFIKRNEYPGPHSNQVGFPGGVKESSDLTSQETALRETKEETGINGPVEIVGSLTPLYIPVSNYNVTPFVGWIDYTPEFNHDPSEVQYLITVELADLLKQEIRGEEKIEHHGIEFMAPCFYIENDFIWGATAMILNEFLELVGERQAPRY